MGPRFRGDDSLRADESDCYELVSKRGFRLHDEQGFLPAHHHIEDRCLSPFGGGERALQHALQFGAVFDALAVEAEMASQSLIVRSVDGHAEMQIFAGRGAIGIVMYVTLSPPL